ncbi:DUF805 domain-containing protein [Snodgrassella communis]|uniref:DUF805 domain-containing protein n=1 Tax=Snodgrassella communis TaxID=2946699 RepID=UPI00286D130A|nr:DUF805 domain-containing protein [Snodgrassella communis]WMY90926.1 DUF805 domain-containing protein [Snodgrassella communis]
MIESYKRFWHNILNFSGTSNRADYWWPMIINYVLGISLTYAVQKMLGHPINEIYTWGDWTINFAVLAIGFVVWIASLSLLFRRLHDTNRSAWWILISLVPLIGQIWLVILTLLPSKPNRFHQGFF